MPKIMKQETAKKPAKKTVPAKARVVQEEREVKYPRLEVCEVPIPVDRLKITVKDAIDYLGWETEADYFNRRKEENPKVNRDAVSFGSDYLLEDWNKNKIRCSYNSKNRPFSLSWSRSLAYDILNRNWRFNCETIIISKYGTIISGQHRLIALILAYQEWSGENSMHWAEKWPEEPYIESFVVTGASEDQEVVNTIDNVRSRSLSDVIYTSPLFSELFKDERKKASDMLQNAVNFLWERVVTARLGGDIPKTHAISIDFFDRHKKLLYFVNELMKLDSQNQLSKAGISSVGKCSSAAYLMASGDSDPDEYTSVENPNEECLNWNREKKALKFWEELAKKTALFEPLRRALNELMTVNGDKPRFIEQLCCLAKAWPLFLEDAPMAPKDIVPRYKELDDGKKEILEWPTFGGIDYGQPGKTDQEGGSETVSDAIEMDDSDSDPDEDKDERARIFEGKVQANNEKMKRNGPYAHENSKD